MHKNAILSTEIDAEIKRAIDSFCLRQGLKLRYLVEQALIEQLEDAIDIEAYWARRMEKTIPFSKILAGRKRKK